VPVHATNWWWCALITMLDGVRLRMLSRCRSNQLEYPLPVSLALLYSVPVIIIIIMALQPFVGPWPLFSFLTLYTAGRTPLTGDQPVARPLPTHRTTQTQNKRTQKRHPCLEWDSSGRRRFMPHTAGPLWSACPYDGNTQIKQKLENQFGVESLMLSDGRVGYRYLWCPNSDRNAATLSKLVVLSLGYIYSDVPTSAKFWDAVCSIYCSRKNWKRLKISIFN
jgi:hypothetical protein